MESFATVVYVLTDEVIRILKIQDDPQAIMSNAEIITFAIFTAKYFSGNYKISRYLCKRLRLFPNILSNSRLNRRIRNIPPVCWQAIFKLLALIFSGSKEIQYFAVDSFPVACCQKNRIDKRKLFLERKHLGFAASKKRYFCGIKVHMIVTDKGKPIELLFTPASESDINVLWRMEIDIPENSFLYADGAYNCFELEDILQDDGIRLLAKRGCKAKNRLRSIEEEKQISSKRQIIETAFSRITALFPRSIKARTEQGFLIKIFCFVLAYSASFLCNTTLI